MNLPPIFRSRLARAMREFAIVTTLIGAYLCTLAMQQNSDAAMARRHVGMHSAQVGPTTKETSHVQ